MPPPIPAPHQASNATASPSTAPQSHSAYALLNSPSSTEQQIEEEIERVASGIFSVVVTLGKLVVFKHMPFIPLNAWIGHVPIIRAPKGNAGEMVAKKLEQKIRDAILSSARSHSASLFAQDASGLSNLQRPRT